MNEPERPQLFLQCMYQSLIDDMEKLFKKMELNPLVEIKYLFYPPATDDEIQEAEVAKQIKFPREYKTFLKVCNGFSYSIKTHLGESFRYYHNYYRSTANHISAGVSREISETDDDLNFLIVYQPQAEITFGYFVEHPNYQNGMYYHNLEEFRNSKTVLSDNLYESLVDIREIYQNIKEEYQYLRSQKDACLSSMSHLKHAIQIQKNTGVNLNEVSDKEYEVELYFMPFYEYVNPELDLMALSYLNKIGERSVTHLSLENLENGLIIKNLECCQQISSLKLSLWEGKVKLDPTISYPSIISLEIYFIRKPILNLDFLLCFPNLKYLKIKTYDVIMVSKLDLSPLTQLETLDFDFRPRLNDDPSVQWIFPKQLEGIPIDLQNEQYEELQNAQILFQ